MLHRIIRTLAIVLLATYGGMLIAQAALSISSGVESVYDLIDAD